MAKGLLVDAGRKGSTGARSQSKNVRPRRWMFGDLYVYFRFALLSVLVAYIHSSSLAIHVAIVLLSCPVPIRNAHALVVVWKRRHTTFYFSLSLSLSL